jgi:hypothetical protein
MSHNVLIKMVVSHNVLIKMIVFRKVENSMLPNTSKKYLIYRKTYLGNVYLYVKIKLF